MVGFQSAARWRNVSASVLPPLALAVCLWLLGQQVSLADAAALVPGLMAIPLHGWATAMLAAALSFFAVGRFELAVRDALALDGPRGRAARAGMVAVALAQTVGFGAISGALARWRALPELGGAGAARLALAVSVAFLAMLAFWTGAALLWAMGGQAALLLAMAAVALAAILRLGPLPWLPGLRPRTGAAALVWGGVDLAAGAAVLALLLPAAALPDWSLFLAAYLAALIVGVLSQSPGGLGAFEVTFIALLPAMPEGGLLAGLLAYRVIYHLIPAAMALLLLARPAQPLPPPALIVPEGGARERTLARAPHGDWALARNGAQVLVTRDQAQGWLADRAGRHLVGIGSPLGEAHPADLARHASRAGLRPLLYKCDARTAVRARAAGWRVVPVAAEAVIDPAGWSLDRPACRSLRRKLRHATAAGLRIERATGALPLGDMAALSARWAAAHGRERGFSMGRHDPALLRRAVVCLAWLDGRLIGFVSFNPGRNDWALDLMRQEADAPDGTMTALIALALSEARAAGVSRLSLAAVPRLPGWVPAGLTRHLAAPGLAQFKRSFGPLWLTRYAAAPSLWQLAGGLVAVTRAIHWPDAPASMNAPHDDHAENRFELPAPPCETRPTPAQALPVTAAATRLQPGNPHDQRPFPPS